MRTTRASAARTASAPTRSLRLGRRSAQLLAGLVLYGASMAMLIRSQLGNTPWDVLHQGLARHLPLSIGAVTVLVGLVVLLAWIPLRERPGVGTVANALLIGVALDATLAVLPVAGTLPAGVAMAVLGVVLNGVATAAYIGARLGPGPRDGLMTGLARRTGRSIRLVRTGLEVAVVITGWVLGGILGPATLLYALSIGPLAQVFLRHLTVTLPPPDEENSGSTAAPPRPA